jgi:hypothetical protein
MAAPLTRILFPKIQFSALTASDLLCGRRSHILAAMPKTLRSRRNTLCHNPVPVPTFAQNSREGGPP